MPTIVNLIRLPEEEKIYEGPTVREAVLTFAQDRASIMMSNIGGYVSMKEIFNELKEGQDYKIVDVNGTGRVKNLK